MSLDETPRVLFLTPVAFNGVTGGGITFSSLFRGWPRDRLATVHADPEPVSTDVCDTYYRLGRAEIDLAWPLSALRRSPATATGEATGTPAATGTPSLARRLALAVLGDPPPQRGRLSPDLERWIEAFRPQVLYTILGTNGMMDLVEAVRQRFDLPLVVHIMDDWPAASYRSGLLGPLERARMNRHLDRLIGAATTCLAISPAMAEAYGVRYGRPFTPFQNTIDTAARSPDPAPEPTVGSPAEVLYVGSIFANAQLDSLIDCARAVAALNDAGRPVRLRIASPLDHAARYRSRLELHPAITIEDTIRDDETFFRRIREADVLLLPVNFDADSVRFIRYSMPTKVPAYLVSGTPLLAYGPAETAQIAYARDAGWAQVVDRRGVEGLGKALAELLDDGDLRRRLTAAAGATARANHDAATVRSGFQAVLRAAATAGKEGKRA